MPKLDYVDLDHRVAPQDERREVMQKLESKPEVTDLITKYQDVLHFSARRMAGDFGIPVVEVGLPGKLAGFLNPTNEGIGWEIVINSRLSEVQKRWAIIHELCHWILDMDCAPAKGDVRRILPLFLGSDKDTYSQYEVLVRERFIQNGQVRLNVSVELDPFIQLEEETVRRSERMANWLCGYILMPERTLRPLLMAHPTARDLATIYRVPISVARMQLTLSLNHRATRRRARNTERTSTGKLEAA